MGDIIILAVIILSMCLGARKGFLRSLAGVLSTVISFALTAVLFKPIGKILKNSPVRGVVFKKISGLLENSNDASSKLFSAVQKDGVESIVELAINLISFIAVIITVKIVLAIIFRAVKITAKLPMVKQADSLLGGAFGFLGGILICYIIIGLAEISAQSGALGWLSKAFEKSFLSAFFYRTDFLLNIFRG